MAPWPSARRTPPRPSRASRARRRSRAPPSRRGSVGSAPGAEQLVGENPTRRPDMARRNARKDHEAEAAQPPLVPMSEEETKQAGITLAKKIAELEELETDHK